jgi:hypothetical protein
MLYYRPQCEGVSGSGSMHPCILNMALDVYGLIAPSMHTKKKKKSLGGIKSQPGCFKGE